MPVIDASVLAEYVGAGEHRELARVRVRAARAELIVPHLTEVEVGHVLRSKVAAERIRPGAARAALAELLALPLLRHPHTPLLERAWELRKNVSFYDGIYLAMAERLKVPLVTFDARLARVPRLRAEVEVLPGAA